MVDVTWRLQSSDCDQFEARESNFNLISKDQYPAAKDALCTFTLASELFFLICDRNTTAFLIVADFLSMVNSSSCGITGWIIPLQELVLQILSS